MTVLYTPGQLRSAVSIAPETYRHWKKAIEPLRRGRGHSPCFTSGDLLAVAIIHRLTVGLAIRVGALSPVAGSLFEVCNASPWPTLERATLLINLFEPGITVSSEPTGESSDDPIIVLPVGPVIELLRSELLAGNEANAQPSLRFPPMAIKPLAAANGGRL